MFKKEDKSVGIIRAVMITIGAILFITAAAAVMYRFFKKHFKITLECGDYDFGDDDCYCDDSDFEPECCVYDSCCCDNCTDEPSSDDE